MAEILKRKQEFDQELCEIKNQKFIDSHDLYISCPTSLPDLYKYWDNENRFGQLIIMPNQNFIEIFTRLFKKGLSLTLENVTMAFKEEYPNLDTEEQLKSCLEFFQFSRSTSCQIDSAYDLILHALNIGLDLKNYKNFFELRNHVHELGPNLLDQINNTTWTMFKMVQEDERATHHISDYTNCGFYTLNSRLRCKPESLAILNGYMAKAPSNTTPFITTRVLKSDIFKDCKIGSIFVNHGYVSTSVHLLDLNKISQDTVIIKINIPKGSHYLAGVSSREFEYLFPHKSEFVIKNKSLQTFYLRDQNNRNLFSNETLSSFDALQMLEFSFTLKTITRTCYELDYREPKDLFPQDSVQ